MPITLTRSLLVILIPGGIIVAPWVLWLVAANQKISTFYDSHSTFINICLFGVVVIVGSFLEGISTHLEVRWDTEFEEELDVKNNWYAYLAQICQAEPVGFRYISRLATTMYFEMSMMWASSIFGLSSLLIIKELKPMYSCIWAIVIVALSIGAFYYFLWQAKHTYKCLCRTRKELNERIK